MLFSIFELDEDSDKWDGDDELEELEDDSEEDSEEEESEDEY
jgi:hypothetical protein